MIKKILYAVIYLLLANSLFRSFAGMAAAAMEDESQGVQPVLQILFVAVCLLFCMVSHRKTIMSKNGKWLIVFLLYTLLISIFHGLIIGFHKKTSVFLYAQPVLLFFVEYYAQQDEKVRKLTPFFVIALACWIVFLFFKNYQTVVLATMQSFFTTNSSYYLLYFLPMLFLFINERYRKYVFLIALVVMVLSSKRGGLLALSLGFLAYSYTYGRISNRKWKGFLRVLILLVVLYFAFVWLNNYMGGIVVERFEGAMEDEGHGRIDIWTQVWFLIQQSDIFHSLFGHGYSSVITDSGTGYSAHNDYLEILYDFGWIGLILFVGAIVSWFVYAARLIKLQSKAAPILMMALFIFITNCTFSHIVIYTLNFNLFTLFFGAFLGIEYRSSLT